MVMFFVFLIVYLAEAFIGGMYFSRLLSVKRSRGYSVFAFGIGYFFLFIISQSDIKGIALINTVAYLGVNILLAFIVYEVKIYTALFYSAILTISMSFSEIFLVQLLSSLMRDFSVYPMTLSKAVLLAVGSKLMFFVFVQIFIKIFGDRRDIHQGIRRVGWILCLFPTGTVSMLLTFLSICINSDLTIGQEWLVFASTIIMLGLNILVFWGYCHIIKSASEHMDMQMQLQKEAAEAKYYRLLAEKNENQRVLIHDIKKHLYFIAHLNEAGQKEDLSEYVERLTAMDILRPSVQFCSSPQLNVILEHYRQVCVKAKIRMDIDIQIQDFRFIQADEMTALMGNLLDNAVQAAGACKEDRFIEFRIVPEAGALVVITVVNSCGQAPVKLNHWQYLSSKKNSGDHGYGLKSIRKIVENHRGEMQSYYDEKDGTFHMIIMLKSQ